MAENNAPAKGPDVLARNLPALSATSDVPGAAETVTVATPATSEAGGAKPEPAKAEPAKSPEGVDKTPPVEGDKAPPFVADADKGDGKTEPKKGIQKRFSEMSADVRAAEAKAATEETNRKAAEARADKLSADLEKALQAIDKVVPPQTDNPRPDRAKYDDPAKYDEDLSSWARKEGEKLGRAEAEQSFKAKTDADALKASEDAQKAENERIGTEWQQRSAKFAEEHADFEDVIKNDKVQITVPMTQAIVTSDIGPKVAYYLGQNPEEAAKIAALTPVAQLVAMGRLEATLSAPPKTTTTPPPIEPIKGGTQAATRKSASEESMEEYAARRNPELRPAASNGRART